MTLPAFGQPIARMNPITLDDLDGVVIAAPAAGDILVYDGIDTWRNRAMTGDIAITAAGLTAIQAGVIVDADINAAADIQVSKFLAGAARQVLQTDALGTGVEWTDNVDLPGTLDVTGLGTFDAGVIIVAGNLDMNGVGEIVNIGAAGNDFGAAQLDLVAGYIIQGAGNLSILAAAGDDVLIGGLTNGTILFVDDGNTPGTIGIGGGANANVMVFLQGDFGAILNNRGGMEVTTTAHRVANDADTLRGVTSTPTIGASNTANWTATVGIRAFFAVPVMAGGSGTITGSAAYLVGNASVAGVTLTNQYGIYFEDLTSATTLNTEIAGANDVRIAANGVILLTVDGGDAAVKITVPDTVAGTGLMVTVNDGSHQEIMRDSSSIALKDDWIDITLEEARRVLDVRAGHYSMGGIRDAGFFVEDFAQVGITDILAYTKGVPSAFKTFGRGITAYLQPVVKDHEERLGAVEVAEDILRRENTDLRTEVTRLRTLVEA